MAGVGPCTANSDIMVKSNSNKTFYYIGKHSKTQVKTVVFEVVVLVWVETCPGGGGGLEAQKTRISGHVVCASPLIGNHEFCDFMVLRTLHIICSLSIQLYSLW